MASMHESKHTRVGLRGYQTCVLGYCGTEKLQIPAKCQLPFIAGGEEYVIMPGVLNTGQTHFVAAHLQDCHSSRCAGVATV